MLSSLLATIPVVAASLIMTTGYLVAAEVVPEIALAGGFTDWPAATVPVFIAMMFGATLGGNATLIGASANRLLSISGLDRFTDRRAKNLSGGMKQKLGICCALISSPEVILLDEPTLGVDPVSRREFWTLLGNLRVDKGTTVFVCTPYMDEAERCVRVGLTYAGRLIASDTPASIKSMVTGDLLELTPSDLASSQSLVGTLEGVRELQPYGDKLHVFVDDADRRRPEIAAALNAQGIRHDELRRIDVRMEEAFISLIRQRTQTSFEGNAPGARMDK